MIDTISIIRNRLVLIALTIVLVNFGVNAQEANFSMYHYTPFFTNPGQLGAEEDARLMLNYRNQSIDVGENFSTSSLSGYVPISIGAHRLVIGGNFLNDQVTNFQKTNGGMLGLALSLKTTKNSELSMGMQGGYFQTGTSSNNFTTDDQFVNGAFDPNSISNDAVINQNINYPTLSIGIHYQIKDSRNRVKAYIGGSIFNINEPNTAFSDSFEDPLPKSFKTTAGFRIYESQKFSVMPTVRWINQADNNSFSVGSRLGYELSNTEKGPSTLSAGLWYNTNKLAVLSLAYETPKVTIGASYDVPLNDNLNTGQNGIFELALSFRIRKSKNKNQEEPIQQEEVVIEETKEEKIVVVVPEEKTEENTTPIVQEKEIPVPETEQEIEKVEESIIEQSQEEEEVPIELSHSDKLTLSKTVKFDLNSDSLDTDTKAFLTEIKDILEKDDRLKIMLIGHACDLGPEDMNYDLSVERANSVKKHLIENGIPASKIIAKGEGEKNPIDTSKTEEGRRHNRRVEFMIVE